MIKIVNLKPCQCNCCKNWRMFNWEKELRAKLEKAKVVLKRIEGLTHKRDQNAAILAIRTETSECLKELGE